MAKTKQNTKFAKALVSSDKHKREKTFERLRKWLQAQQRMDLLAMKKVWRAIFYAMWHSDGREVQRELAEEIGDVVHSLKPQMAVLYCSVFFWTMRNEWAGIDKHRLDKYCVLARKMQSASFKYLKDRNWDENVSRSFSDRVYRDALFGEDDGITAIDIGIKLHVAEAFAEEIRRFDLRKGTAKNNVSKKKKKSLKKDDSDSDDDKENVDVDDDDDDISDDENEEDSAEAPPQEIIKMLLVSFMHGMRNETSFSFLKRCASDVFDVFCPTDVDKRNASRNKNGWVLNASYIKDLARVAIELGAGNGCPETSREALYELHTDLKKSAVVAEKAPSIELKRDQKLVNKVANRIMSEENSSSSSSSGDEEEEEEEDSEEKVVIPSASEVAGFSNEKKNKRAEIRVIEEEDVPEKKKHKKNKKKKEKSAPAFEENPFERAQQEKHKASIVAQQVSEKSTTPITTTTTATATAVVEKEVSLPDMNGHAVAARRALNFKPKKYQTEESSPVLSSPSSSSPSKRLSWNLKGITRSFPSGAIDTSKGVHNIKTSTPTKGLLRPIHAIGKGSPATFMKSKYFPGPSSAPLQSRTRSMFSPRDYYGSLEDDDYTNNDDNHNDNMILGIKRNLNSSEKKKNKKKNKDKKRHKKNKRLTM